MARKRRTAWLVATGVNVAEPGAGGLYDGSAGGGTEGSSTGAKGRSAQGGSACA